MKKVIFNYYGMQACCESKFHGASEYGKTVLKYLAENYSDIAFIAIIYNPVCVLDGWLEKVLSDNGVIRLEIKNMEDISSVVKEFQPDVFYSPTRLPSTVRNQFEDNVLIKETLHDFRGIELIDDIRMLRYMSARAKVRNVLKWITKKYYRRYLIAKEQKNINIIDSAYCVSKHTYYSMQILFNNLQMKKISVFYSPEKYVSLGEKNISPIQRGKYILTLGGDRWTKNPFRTALALDLVLSMKKYSEYKVVVIGNIPKQLKKRIKNIDRFVFSGYVDTEVLENYYMNCDVFVYASLNEGFGYPPIEAMKYGKTCVVSGTSSLPEVCGEAVYYVDPYNVHEIAEKVTMAVNEKIDESIIKKRERYINQRQLLDLKKMCDDIIGK